MDWPKLIDPSSMDASNLIEESAWLEMGTFFFFYSTNC